MTRQLPGQQFNQCTYLAQHSSDEKDTSNIALCLYYLIWATITFFLCHTVIPNSELTLAEFQFVLATHALRHVTFLFWTINNKQPQIIPPPLPPITIKPGNGIHQVVWSMSLFLLSSYPMHVLPLTHPSNINQAGSVTFLMYPERQSEPSQITDLQNRH